MKVQKTRITIATHRLVVIRRKRIVRFWCPECGGESDFVPVDDLNKLLADEADRSQYLNPQLHFVTAQDGTVVVCIRSLSMGEGPRP